MTEQSIDLGRLTLEELEVVHDEFDTLNRSGFAGVCRWAGWWWMRLDDEIQSRHDAAEAAVEGLPVATGAPGPDPAVGLDTLGAAELQATWERITRCLGRDDRPGVVEFASRLAESIGAEAERRAWALLRERAEADRLLAEARPELVDSPIEGIPSWEEASAPRPENV